jgi:hypothetical protein
MSKADEFVEKLIGEGYKRELDQEENVVRSLPFFATSLGVLATALGLARPAIGPFALAAFPLAIYATLGFIGLAILLVLVFLLQATRPRQFKLPMSEQALLGYRTSLRDYYAASGKDEATLAEAMLADMREEVTRQVAEATRITRQNNLARLRARGRAVTALVAAIFLAFVLLGLILGRDAGG